MRDFGSVDSGGLIGSVLADEIREQRRVKEQLEIDEKTKLLTPDQKKSWVDGYNAAKEKARAEEGCCIIL